MERLQEVKALLKRWEAAFEQQQGRKPGTGDVEGAPEDVRRLYREYRALKHRGDSAATGQDSGCWGAHLNRRPATPKPAPTPKPPPKFSAQHFGTKLKANLGASIEERPAVPRRTLTPHPTPVPNWDFCPPSPRGDEDGGDPPEFFLPPSLTPKILAGGPKPHPKKEKSQKLLQTVAKRLSNLDPAWLRRCQGDPDPKKPPRGGPEIGGVGFFGVGGGNADPIKGSGGAEGARGENEGGENGVGGDFDPEKGVWGGGGDPKKLPNRVGGKRGRGDSGGGGGEGPARKKKPENLLGEVEEEEEEEKKKPPRRAAPNRPPPGNFVRLNLRTRSHVRGWALRGRQLRQQVWKQKWQKKAAWFGGGGAGSTPPLPKKAEMPQKEDEEEEEGGDEDEAPLPTLAEVARRTNSVCPELWEEFGNPEGVFGGVTTPPEPPPEPPAPMEPLYPLGPGGKLRETPPEVLEALQELGFSSFRPGQERAVMRILSGLSTLLVLPTGLGKSLCYQLPAYLYRKRSPCVTLVVSPLVALMDDQVSGLPRGLRAARVHSNMSGAQREAALEQVKRGEVHVLLLSPEALVGGGRGGGCCLPPAPQLPPVAFACLDEAHCMAQWAHNFRPSYLRICKVLRDRLGVRCFLGLTATATRATAREVAAHLGVPRGEEEEDEEEEEEDEDEGSTGRRSVLPPNLHLSVSMDRDRDQALVSLLRGERFGRLASVIVYCTRREETERVAALLRTSLRGTEPPETPKNMGKKQKKAKCSPTWVADAYHAGLSAAERRRVQRAFMAGRLRAVVATVAFGMGLDKADVRGVVHYNMPQNFENYVQEIGRAGRDGKPAHCHLFLHPEGEDLHELRRHIYGATVDFLAVKKLLLKVFSPCKCRELHQKHRELSGDSEPGDAAAAQPQRVCHMHERAVPVQQTVEELDLREEGIETLLCYLELHPRRWLELLPPTYSSCRLRCYGGPRQLRAVARSCPPVAVFLARERLAGRPRAGNAASSLELDVVALSDSMGWEVPLVKRALRQLQWDPRLRPGGSGTPQNPPSVSGSGVVVEFAELAFHFRAYGDLAEEELDSLCQFLHQRVVAREKAALNQLRACFRAFKSVAFPNCEPHPESVEEERSSRLRDLLQDYFQKDPAPKGCEEEEDEEEEEEEEDEEDEDQVRADVRRFLTIRQDEKFSGRAVARIFHGIDSPCYPAQVYGRDRRFWRRHLRFDFHRLMRLATQEILALR